LKKFPFIHLRALSSYSLSEGAIKIKRLVELAKKNSMPSLAIMDNNNMFGALEFAIECSNNGIHPIIGSSINLLEIQNKNFISQLNFIALNETGYKNLLYLSSLSHTTNYNTVGIKLDDLNKRTEGLACFIGGFLNPLLILKKNNKIKEIDDLIKKLSIFFSDNFFFEIQRIKNKKIDDFENEFLNLALKYKISVISSNNVKFENSDDYNAHDALLCIAQKTTIN